jgi:protein phosphatase 1L
MKACQFMCPATLPVWPLHTARPNPIVDYAATNSWNLTDPLNPTHVKRRQHTFSEESSMFGVFDGHGGVECARYIKKHFPALLCERMDKEEPRDALRSAFLATDRNFIQQVTILDADAGSTGVVALIQSGTLYVAHAGDSRAILRRQGEAERLTIDHKPGRVDESERVVRCGGRVVMGRVNGVLAVSRAFGNKHLKSCVTAEPEILKVDLQVGDDYLILASDGLWDVVSDQVALQLVDSHCKQGNGLKEAAELLTSQAMKLGSRDNITVIVVNVRDWHVERQRSSPPGSPFAMDGLMD